MVDGLISAQVVVADPGLSGHGHQTVLGLSWQRDDPLTVHLRLAAQPDHPALPRGSWMVLRDFLRYGLEEPTGDGVVRIRPGEAGLLVLELVGDARPYCMHVPAHLVADFLDATERIVPAGAGAEEEIIDALIERLLDS
jgi:hypothetical protein